MESTQQGGGPVGVVVAARGTWAEVETSRRAACSGCAEARSCGVSGANESREIVAVRNGVGAVPGDTVELDLPASAALRLSFLVWVVPLLGLVGGAVVGATGSWGVDPDAATLVGALGGAALAYALLRRIDRRAATDRTLTPFIARVVPRVLP